MLTNLATFSKILFYLPLDLNYPSVSIYGTSSISHQTLDYYLAWLLRRDNRNILLMHFRQKIARGPVSFSLAPLKMREAFLWLGTTIHLQYKAFRQWSHDVVKVFLFYFNPLVLGCLVEVHSVGCIGVMLGKRAFMSNGLQTTGKKTALAFVWSILSCNASQSSYIAASNLTTTI